MNKSDIFEVIENVAFILCGAVIVDALFKIGKKEDTSAEIKKMKTKALKNAYDKSLNRLDKNSSTKMYDNYVVSG